MRKFGTDVSRRSLVRHFRIEETKFQNSFSAMDIPSATPKLIPDDESSWFLFVRFLQEFARRRDVESRTPQLQAAGTPRLSTQRYPESHRRVLRGGQPSDPPAAPTTDAGAAPAAAAAGPPPPPPPPPEGAVVVKNTETENHFKGLPYAEFPLIPVQLARFQDKSVFGRSEASTRVPFSGIEPTHLERCQYNSHQRRPPDHFSSIPFVSSRRGKFLGTHFGAPGTRRCLQGD